MRFATIFIFVMLLIPVIGVLLYTAFNPRDAALWGKRWQYKNENLEPSDEAVKYNRITAIIGLVVVVLLMVMAIIRF